MKYKMSNKLKVEKIIWIGILKRFSSSDFRSSVVDQPGLLLKETISVVVAMLAQTVKVVFHPACSSPPPRDPWLLVRTSD